MKKLSAKITAVILIVVIAGMVALFALTETKVTDMAKQNAQETLVEAVKTRTEIIKSYMDSLQKSTIAFGQNDVMGGYIRALNGDDQGLPKDQWLAMVEAYIKGCQENVYKDTVEGIFVVDKDTKIVAHTNEDAIGSVLREGDAVEQFNSDIDAAGTDSVFSAGMRQSTATGDMVVVNYYPIRDQKGKMIGSLGCGAYTQSLVDRLDAHPIEGMENANYYLMDVSSGTFLFNSAEPEKVGTAVADTSAELAQTLETAAQGEDGQSNVIMYGKGDEAYILGQVYIADYNWVFMMMDKQNEVFNESKSIALLIAIICIAVTVAIAVVTALVTGSMMKGLPVIADTIKRFGRLDLQIKGTLKKYTGRKDEVGQMANASLEMVTALRDAIGELNESRDAIGGTADTLGGTMQELSDCVANNAAITEELFASITNTNQSVANVEEAVDSVYGSVDNITAKVDQSGEVTNNLLMRAEQIKEDANQSLENSRSTIDAQKERIDEAVDGLHAIENINSMVDEILEISSRTNLLSLNASIEAARAGEAGKGFAVVADEISKLAEQSATTAGHIQDIVRESNTSIDNVRKCFADIIDYMENDILKSFENFASVSEEYGLQSEEIEGAIEAITESMHELRTYMEDIVNSAKTVSMAAEENERAVGEIVEKNETMQDISDKMGEITDTNNVNSEQIGGVVGKFLL